MRGANAYQTLRETHDKVEAGTALPGTRYEPLRETQYEVDAERLGEQPQEEQKRPEPGRSIDAVEARRAALDQELAEMREANRVPEEGRTPQHAGIDDNIERALALQDQPSPDQSSPQAHPQADRIGPERWTESGGMVEQQASAMEWLAQSRDAQRERTAQDQGSPAPQGLSRDDRELLDTARGHEAQTNQQEHGRSHHQDYPAP